MAELVDRLMNVLDEYEMMDNGASAESIAKDVTENPEAIINTLLNRIEEMI